MGAGKAEWGGNERDKEKCQGSVEVKEKARSCEGNGLWRGQAAMLCLLLRVSQSRLLRGFNL